MTADEAARNTHNYQAFAFRNKLLAKVPDDF
jgi:hypothetical protein